eukprot:363853-Chlamydomonas_euryale.AAC.3
MRYEAQRLATLRKRRASGAHVGVTPPHRHARPPGALQLCRPTPKSGRRNPRTPYLLRPRVTGATASISSPPHTLFPTPQLLSTLASTSACRCRSARAAAACPTSQHSPTSPPPTLPLSTPASTSACHCQSARAADCVPTFPVLSHTSHPPLHV